MLRSSKLVLLAGLILATPVGARDASYRTSVGATRQVDSVTAQIDAAAAPLIAQRNTAGFVLGVAKGGKVRLIRGYGFADLEHGVPITERTVFRAGSITKQFTAAALLLLAEDGRLSVDDPLSKYLPAFPRASEVTLRQLLTHTSGIHDYTSKDDFVTKVSARQHSADELIAYIVDSKPQYDFDPGTGWSYSNSGYFLLGVIVEKVSGQPLGQFLRARLFDRLGMTDTRLDDLAEIVPARADGYDRAAASPSGFTNAGFISMSVAAGAGAIRSTARDLIVWHTALLGGKLLKPASLAMMLEPGRLKDGRLASVVRKGVKPGDPPSDYGFGITTGVRDGRRAIGHGGSINGFNAALTTYPDQAVTIVVLMNTTGASGTVTKPMTDAVFTALGYAALPKR